MRAVAGVVVQLPEPAISDGHPSLPEHWARTGAQATLIEGPDHIHAIPDPNPVWDPATSGWTVPPSSLGTAGAGEVRWTVDSLPDPAGAPGGWYWLGDNGGGGEDTTVHEWPVAGGTFGPSWHSFFPFRPSVAPYDAYLGSKRIHHPKGVHFNSHYVEHMWADFGGFTNVQPCTWIIVATIGADPFGGYSHNLLDAGRNPDDVGFGRISAAGASRERRINDGLDYRTSLSVSSDTAAMLTKDGDAPLRQRGAPGSHPRMYVAMFDGAQSHLAVYDPFGRYLTKGSVSDGPGFANRFIVIGREQGWISQRRASNVLMFEMRFWRRALSAEELDQQYAQLSSTFQFDAYKTL